MHSFCSISQSLILDLMKSCLEADRKRPFGSTGPMTSYQIGLPSRSYPHMPPDRYFSITSKQQSFWTETLSPFSHWQNCIYFDLRTKCCWLFYLWRAPFADYRVHFHVFSELQMLAEKKTFEKTNYIRFSTAFNVIISFFTPHCCQLV